MSFSGALKAISAVPTAFRMGEQRMCVNFSMGVKFLESAWPMLRRKL